MQRLGLFCVLLSLAAAEKILGRAEPIPSDKCGASVITDVNEKLHLFSLSEDSVVWHKFQKADSSWSVWRPLANRQKMSSGPKAVRHANGTIQVFARGADRKYYISTLNEAKEWSDWTSPFAEKFFLTPPAPVVTSSGQVYLFGVEAVNSSVHTVFVTESSAFTDEKFEWSAWLNLGGESTGPVAVLLDGEGLAHVFIRGANRALWHLGQTFAHKSGVRWGEWECLGGLLASAPKVPATLTGANLVEVYARAADKALWHRAQVSTLDSASAPAWDKWESLGGVFASGPSAVVSDDGLTSVYARATDKAIYFRSQFHDDTGKFEYTRWNTLGGMFSTTPTVVVKSSGLTDVFARGIDKAIWHSHQTENVNGTRSFSAWHSLGGHTRKYTC